MMATTEICSRCGIETRYAKNAIIDGKFAAYCPGCIATSSRQASAGYAQYSRDRDREDNKRDLIQPWSGGIPNREFIREYPEESQDMFTKEELEEYS